MLASINFTLDPLIHNVNLLEAILLLLLLDSYLIALSRPKILVRGAAAVSN